MGGGEILLILIAILVLFGADKMPGIARGIGKGMREFQKAADEIKAELTNSTSDIRNEMNNIRSDIQQNISEARPDLDDIKSTLNNTTSDPIKIEADTPDSSYPIYEEAEKKSAPNPKADEARKAFLDEGANI